MKDCCSTHQSGHGGAPYTANIHEMALLKWENKKGGRKSGIHDLAKNQTNKNKGNPK